MARSRSRRCPAEPNGTGLLFAYDAGNHVHQYGGRVFGDGRYELYSGANPGEKPEWTSYDPFTPEQVDEIAAAVDRALAAGIPDQVPGSDPPTPDAGRATFTLRDRKIAVDEYPNAAPNEIERILEEIARLRKRPPVPSTWRVWSKGEVVELEARCEIGEVAALSPLRDAIFMPSSPTRSTPTQDDPPKDTPLVSIAFAQRRAAGGVRRRPPRRLLAAARSKSRSSTPTGWRRSAPYSRGPTGPRSRPACADAPAATRRRDPA